MAEILLVMPWIKFFFISNKVKEKVILYYMLQ